MRNSAVRLAVAGLAVAGAAALPATAAMAASTGHHESDGTRVTSVVPAGQHEGDAATAAAARSYVAARADLYKYGHVLSAVGSVGDLTTGDHQVAVQTLIKHKVGSGWVTVYKGPRRTSTVSAAASVIKWTQYRCVQGQVYRAFVNWSAYNMAGRGTVQSGSQVC